MVQRIAVVPVALVLLAGASAWAQGEAPKADEPGAAAVLDRSDAKWTISVEPAGWFVGASGRLHMPRSAPSSSPDKVEIQNLNLDNPRFVPFAEVNVRKGDWRFAARGFLYDAEKSASGNFGQIGDVTFNTGDTLRSEMHFASYELEGAYRVMGGPQNIGKDGIAAIDSKFDIVGGLRLYDMDMTVRNVTTGPAEADASGWYPAPLVGAKLSMDLWRDVTIDLQVTLGGLPLGSRTSYSGDIIAGFMYRPTAHVGVQIGYRSLFFGMEDGSGDGKFSFNGAMQGLYGGLVFRF